MTALLPAPSIEIATVRRAHVETERGAQFAELLERLAIREARRDFYTGLPKRDRAEPGGASGPAAARFAD